MKSTIARSSRRPLRPTFIMAGSFDAVATLPSRETRGGPAAAPLPVLLAPKVADRLADLGRVREALLGQALERRADVPGRADRDVVLGRVLDLLASAVDEDSLLIVVDAIDQPGRDQHPLAEDPRAGVDDHPVLVDVLRRLVDRPDRPVSGFHFVTRQVATGFHALRVPPHLR